MLANAARGQSVAHTPSLQAVRDAPPQRTASPPLPAPRRRSQRLAARQAAEAVTATLVEDVTSDSGANSASGDSGSEYTTSSSTRTAGAGEGGNVPEDVCSPLRAQRAHRPLQCLRAASASPSMQAQLARHLQRARPPTPIAQGSPLVDAHGGSPSLREKLAATLKQAKRPSAEPSSQGAKRRRRSSTTIKWEEQSVRPESPPPNEATWVPPASPFGLLEEQLYHDPWKLLLACMLLNKTNASKVRAVWPRLMELAPTPQAACAASPDALEATIHSLGFHRSRARAIGAMSHDYLHTPWTRPSQLRHVGKYASDAYFMFCRGKWRGVQPEDKELKRYHAWLQTHGGASTGLEREPLL